MSYIGNEPVSQATRLVFEETVTVQGKQTFTPPGGYTVGKVDVEVNGSGLGSQDFTATDGVTVTLAVGCGIGDLVKITAWGDFTLASVPGAAINDGSISTSKLADDSVTAAKIAANAVGTSEVADGAITAAKLASGAVPSPALGGQVFTASGTFTIPAGITAVKVTVVGGGGGGGSYVGGTNASGGAGGGGGAAISFLTGLTPGGTLTVTRGAGGSAGTNGNSGSAGGTSSVASGTQTISTISATGGGGGYTTNESAGGAGGAGSGGTLNLNGNPGMQGGYVGDTTTFGWKVNPAGGASLFGGGGRTFNGTGGAGTNGGGGSGSTGGTAGAGGNGVIIFEW